jgi:hypothetical protein
MYSPLNKCIESKSVISNPCCWPCFLKHCKSLRIHVITSELVDKSSENFGFRGANTYVTGFSVFRHTLQSPSSCEDGECLQKCCKELQTFDEAKSRPPKLHADCEKLSARIVYLTWDMHFDTKEIIVRVIALYTYYWLNIGLKNRTPCSLVEVHQSFGDILFEDGGSSSSETSVKFYQTIQRHNLDNSN